MHRPLKPSLLGQSQLLAPNGTPIGATIGFLNVLHKVVEKFKPQRLCVVFDTPTQTHRKKEDPTYKANRERMDMTLRSQFPLTQFVLDILQVPQVRLPGFEADDLIASYTTASVLVGYDVVVVSEDNDFLQLVREGPPRVSVYKPQRKWHLNEVDVRRVLGGSSPKMQPDMRALQGDRSGKSPGLPGGIEQSQAVSVLEKAGGLVSLLDRLDKVDNAALRTRLTESTEMLMVSYRASKLDDAIDPLPTAMDQFNSSKVDLDLLSKLVYFQMETPTTLQQATLSLTNLHLSVAT
ncbi:hypothetical protein LEN26_005799 [Aphanomyces euteiches]|nr:hypothetical protein AeMF1_015868 [Aphanomyces euteiches]KAH9137279.1 hypothetical protein LEN26_005799 [Aphanomyces euteiches]KAH9195400.1 hypothetical protein AeNC1_002608 [Aphanomyces euteiches]